MVYGLGPFGKSLEFSFLRSSWSSFQCRISAFSALLGPIGVLERVAALST